jgi:hypothetical protein
MPYRPFDEKNIMALKRAIFLFIPVGLDRTLSSTSLPDHFSFYMAVEPNRLFALRISTLSLKSLLGVSPKDEITNEEVRKQLETENKADSIECLLNACRGRQGFLSHKKT